MMPGENQSVAGGVASEATPDTCQNCTVLIQNLEEYVTALLTLKQKIIDTDILLSEYKEKCDELQKSQRESAKLHKELDEVLLKLGPLEKQTVEYEAVRSELKETTAALKLYQAKSEELDGLREENAKAFAMNAKLEETCKKVEEAANTQSLENSKLRSEMKVLECELQKTQDSLKASQQAVEEVENLKVQNTKALIVKSTLENQLLVLEDMTLKQNNTIRELKRQNSSLEKSVRLNEEKIATFEKEFNKEKISSFMQTENEPEVDKAKIWTLLQEVWHCVAPLSETQQTFDVNDNPHLQITPLPSLSCSLSVRPFINLTPHPAVATPQGAQLSPEKSKSESSLQNVSSPSKTQSKSIICRKKKRRLDSEQLDKSCTKTDKVPNLAITKDAPVDHLIAGNSDTKTHDIWEIFRLYGPLPAALSPLPPDEMLEMEVDSYLKKCSNLNAENEPKSQSADSKPLEDNVAVSSDYLSSESRLTMVTSDTPDIGNKIPQRESVENQNLQVEKLFKMQKNAEDSICVVTVSQNESDGECIGQKLMTRESQLGTTEELPNHINSKPQCNANCEVPKANSSDRLGHGLESVQQVVIHDESPEYKSAQHQSNVKDDVSGYSLHISPTPQACSEKQSIRTVEEIQSGSTTTDSLTYEDQNGYLRQDNQSSCIKLNGVTCKDSSDEEEFQGLKRKVRGILLRPDVFGSAASGKLLPNEKEANNIDKVQGTNSESKEGHLQLEKENDDEDCSITMKSVILENKLVVDVEQVTGLAKIFKQESDNGPNSSVFGTHSQQEECVLPMSFSPKNKNMDDTLKEDCAKQDGPIVNSDICHASPVNTPTLSSLEKSEDVPLIDVAFRNALTSTQSAESIGMVRTEMGPPLPPLVLPLTATPPKFRIHLNPDGPTIQLPTSSTAEGPFSPSQHSKVPCPNHGLQDDMKMSSSVTTPSPSRAVLSSPLQFGSATPKHALPVPGRLPSSALNSSPSSSTQENSMQMLDTMYPELSAQARTLNILRGNVNLGRAGNENGSSPPPVNPISGNKTINSSSTAFTKADQKVKRIGANVLLPRSAKRLRLDACSPDPLSLISPLPQDSDDKPSNSVASPECCPAILPSINNQFSMKELQTEENASDTKPLVFRGLEKLKNSCFDLIPVIKSHIFLGRISEVPVLRDEEKIVISDFCLNQTLAEEFMLAILSKIKYERATMKHDLLQSLCRVYVGLCRWRGDVQKAHAFAYSLLKEDFPEAPKLILFMVTTWPTVLSHDSTLCQAINLVSKLKAEGEILDYLSTYLHWDETPPGDIQETITTILQALLKDDTLEFQHHDRNGTDLCPATWSYIFSLDLLCAHLGWKWTHDNIIGKALWPVMNDWVTQPRSQQTPVRDICVAAVLRLIGRLGQLGLKEKLYTSVQNVAKAINLFGKHGISEGVPWEVQLSAVYTIYDLAPSNPKEALQALASWRGEITFPVAPAITSCITQIGSICRQIGP